MIDDDDYHLRRGLSAPPSMSAHLHAFRKSLSSPNELTSPIEFMKKLQMNQMLLVSPRRARKSRRHRKKLSLDSLNSKKKGQDLIQYLPSQVMIDILSRLPILSIIRCKCVCKSWLDLIKSAEFINSHLSKSVPGLAVYGVVYGRRKSFFERYRRDDEFVELVDGVDLNCRWKIDLKRLIGRELQLHSCANGLLFLYSSIDRSINIICNPVTREYMKLPPPPSIRQRELELIYGFGVSRMSGIYKVVSIFIAQTPSRSVQCQVYSVGSGGCRWRSITPPGFCQCYDSALGAFLKGNLHWLGYDSEDSPRRIYCIDLETETFTTLSPPPTPLSSDGDEYETIRILSVLGDCLCACDYLLDRYEIEIWLMKEYGDDKSWAKELRIPKASLGGFHASLLCPIKDFGNGDILMEDCLVGKLLYYTSKTATIREAGDVFGLGSNINYNNAMIYIPTFLSLNTTFPMENVRRYN